MLPGRGSGYELIGSEDSELIDWQVKLTRILLRRRRYRRRCACGGPRTACAPSAPKVVPKGLFTAHFLARLLHEKLPSGPPGAPGRLRAGRRRLEVAPGTLAVVLRQVAPLLAPWAQAIAAHGRQAWHVHCDETSWQVFEDVADKANHRWSLWVFETPDTTVFVLEPSRFARVAAGQLGIDLDQTALQAGRRLSSPPTSTGLTSPWPASTAWTRSGALPISAGTSCGPAPPTLTSWASGARRGPSGSPSCTGPTTPWPRPFPAPARRAGAPALPAALHQPGRRPHPADRTGR